MFFEWRIYLYTQLYDSPLKGHSSVLVLHVYKVGVKKQIKTEWSESKQQRLREAVF